MFLFRPANEKDRQDVERISGKIWEGDDYMPYVFDTWLADPHGEFTMIEFENRVVGFAKLSFLTPVDAWFEGLRKDPDENVRGVGTALSRHYLRLVKRKKDLRSVRFSTYIGNTASRILNEKLGFEIIKTLSVKSYHIEGRCPMLNDPPETVSADEALPYIKNIPWYDRFLTDGWRVYPYSDELLRSEFLTQDNVFGVRNNGNLVGLAVIKIDAERRHGKIHFLDAQDDAIAKVLFDHAHHLMQVAGYDYSEAVVPDYALQKFYFDANGYVSWEQEQDFLIYEMPLEKLKEI